jgi:long-chain acyl-CoA synthetase
MPPMDRLLVGFSKSFTLGGRRDSSVQVGGINVYCTQIAESLCTLPGVADAYVRLMRPAEGRRLKAFIVPASRRDESDVRAEVQFWIEKDLSVPQRPKMLNFGTALPSVGPGEERDW